MSRHDPLADTATITSFGKNIFTCCEIAGITVESLGLRTEIDPQKFYDYRDGTRSLARDDIDAIAAEFGIDYLHLVHNHGSSENRTMKMGTLLSKSGYRILSSTAPKAVPDTVSAEIVENSKQEEAMSHEITAAGAENSTEIVWDENGLTGSTAGGVSFDLRPKTLRVIIIGRIRELIDGTDKTLSGIITGANLAKSSSWWRGVETGTKNIYGKDIDSICKYLGVSAFELISGAVQREKESAPAVITSEPEAPSPTPVPAPVEIPVEPETIVGASSEDIGRHEHFRCLVLNVNTLPAEGVTIGQLLELARDQEKVDWEQAYLTLTADGKRLTRTISMMREDLSQYDETIRSIILKALTGPNA